MISILIVDDQDLVREGLRMLLEAEPDLAVAGEAADGNQALSQARLLDPDVILMDVRMPQLDGIEATTRLVQAGSRARILMLTTFNLDEYVYHALKAGASGFLLKDDRVQIAVHAYEHGIVRPGHNTPPRSYQLRGVSVRHIRYECLRTVVFRRVAAPGGRFGSACNVRLIAGRVLLRGREYTR